MLQEQLNNKMKLFTLTLLATLSLLSCANKKKTSEVETVEIPKEEIIIPTDLIKKGYVKAFVKDFSKSDEGCGFLLVLEDSKQVLQPIKPLVEILQSDNLKVWLKYRPIRPIAPACKKGTLINIEDIKNR